MLIRDILTDEISEMFFQLVLYKTVNNEIWYFAVTNGTYYLYKTYLFIWIWNVLFIPI